MVVEYPPLLTLTLAGWEIYLFMVDNEYKATITTATMNNGEK